jgi:hypothetical protein
MFFVLLEAKVYDARIYYNNYLRRTQSNDSNYIYLWKGQNISTSAQYVTLQKYLSHPSLVIWICTTPPIKLKLEQLGEQVSGRQLIAIYLDQSLQMGQSKTLISNQIVFSTLDSACANCPIMLSQNHFLDTNRRVLTFLHSILYPDHILSTAGDALNSAKLV